MLSRRLDLRQNDLTHPVPQAADHLHVLSDRMVTEGMEVLTLNHVTGLSPIRHQSIETGTTGY